MNLNLTYYGNPILRTKAASIAEITDEVRELAAAMVNWVNKHNGLGLAAPQVGHSIRLFVACFPEEEVDGTLTHGDKVYIYINPQLSNPTEEIWSRPEACFSIPGIYPEVVRPVGISVQAIDLEGNSFEQTLRGLPARIIMHENDHINGVLMIDRCSKQERKQWERALKTLSRRL